MKKLLLVLLRKAFLWMVERKSAKGHLEVERKFVISLEEADNLPMRLRELGFSPAGAVTMVDSFLPVQKKGEMMRVRDECMSGLYRSLFTVKTWAHTADGGKERQESESEVSPLFRTVFLVLGRMLADENLLSFSKERSLFAGKFGGLDIIVSIDKVSGLGEFSGLYMEVETIVPLDKDPGKAKEEIFKFVQEAFGKPRQDVQRSYFDMLELTHS